MIYSVRVDRLGNVSNAGWSQDYTARTMMKKRTNEVIDENDIKPPPYIKKQMNLIEITSEKHQRKMYWYSGYTGRSPQTIATKIQYCLKGRYKKWIDSPDNKEYKPYYAIADDIRLQVKIIQPIQTKNIADIELYCINLNKDDRLLYEMCI